VYVTKGSCGVQFCGAVSKVKNYTESSLILSQSEIRLLDFLVLRGSSFCQEYWPNSKDLDEDEVSDLHSVSKASVLGNDVADLDGQISPPVQVEIEVVDVPLNLQSVMFLMGKIRETYSQANRLRYPTPVSRPSLS